MLTTGKRSPKKLVSSLQSATSDTTKDCNATHDVENNAGTTATMSEHHPKSLSPTKPPPTKIETLASHFVAQPSPTSKKMTDARDPKHCTTVRRQPCKEQPPLEKHIRHGTLNKIKTNHHCCVVASPKLASHRSTMRTFHQGPPWNAKSEHQRALANIASSSNMNLAFTSCRGRICNTHTCSRVST